MEEINTLTELLKNAEKFNEKIYNEQLIHYLNNSEVEENKIILAGYVLIIYGYYEEFFREVNKVFWKSFKNKRILIETEKIIDEIESKYKKTFQKGAEAREHSNLYHTSLSSFHNKKYSKVDEEIFKKRTGIIKYSDLLNYEKYFQITEHMNTTSITLSIKTIIDGGLHEQGLSDDLKKIQVNLQTFEAKFNEFLDNRNIIAHTGVIEGINFKELFSEVIYYFIGAFFHYGYKLILELSKRKRQKDMCNDYFIINGRYIACESRVTEDYKYLIIVNESKYYFSEIKNLKSNGLVIDTMEGHDHISIELRQRIPLGDNMKIYFLK